MGRILLSWWRKTLPPPPPSHALSTWLVAEAAHWVFGDEIIRDSSDSADGERGVLYLEHVGILQLCSCRHKGLQCALSSLFWRSARATRSVHAKKNPFGRFCYLFFLPGGLPHGCEQCLQGWVLPKKQFLSCKLLPTALWRAIPCSEVHPTFPSFPQSFRSENKQSPGKGFMEGRQLTLVGGLAEQMLQTGPRASCWGKGQTWELHSLELNEIWTIKLNILEMWGTLSFFFFCSLWWNCLMFANVLEGKEAVFSKVGGVLTVAKICCIHEFSKIKLLKLPCSQKSPKCIYYPIKYGQVVWQGPPSSLPPQRTTGDSCSWHYLNISVLHFLLSFFITFRLKFSRPGQFKVNSRRKWE